MKEENSVVANDSTEAFRCPCGCGVKGIFTNGTVDCSNCLPDYRRERICANPKKIFIDPGSNYTSIADFEDNVNSELIG